MFESYDEQPVTPEAELIEQPTLILHGELDVVVPPAVARTLAATIPNAELVLIPNAGHVPTITRPDAVADAVNAWWSARESTQTNPPAP
jgi:pimeloyl-ACP methyl ester carboxylesterase